MLTWELECARASKTAGRGFSKPQRIFGAGAREKAGLCPWTRDGRCPGAPSQPLLVLGLMSDAGHSQRSLLTRHPQYHREPQTQTAIRAKPQRHPTIWVSPCQASEEPVLSTSEFKSHGSSHGIVLAHGDAICHVRPLDSNPVVTGFELQAIYYTWARAKGQAACSCVVRKDQ